MAAGLLSVQVDTSQVSAMAMRLAALRGELGWTTARAMTNSAKDAKEKLRQEVFPRIIGGPNPWTKRGLVASFARPENLTSYVGFNYGERLNTGAGFNPQSGGVPSGKYMELLSRGGDRGPKGTEKKLRQAGLIGQDQFITPTGRGIKLDKHGNLKGPQYTQILSRLRAFAQEGSSLNATRGADTGSRGRSGAKRRERDYFILRADQSGPTRWQLGARPEAVMMRSGSGPQGGTGKGTGKRGRPQTVGYRRKMVRVLNIVDQPNYERRIDIKGIALREYNRVYGRHFMAALSANLNRRR